MNIIILGPQGSGKGTQAELLAQELGLFHMESGKMLREIARTNKRIEKMLNSGELLSFAAKTLPTTKNTGTNTITALFILVT